MWDSIVFVDNKKQFINECLPLMKKEVNGKVKVNGEKYYKINYDELDKLITDLDNIRSLEFFINNRSNVKYTRLVYMIMKFNVG